MHTHSIIHSPNTFTHTHTHADSPTNTDMHAHIQKKLSRVMVFSVIYCTAIVASAFSIGIIIEIT